MDQAGASAPVLVVGVIPMQAPAVIDAALTVALALRARVVCAHVDTTRFVVDERPDGSTTSRPVDSDAYDDGPSPFPYTLAEHLRDRFARASVEWDRCELAGNPATALSHLAERESAMMIVVGTRRPGFRGAMAEFFDGSVAAHLAHQQHRPVLVVPQAPVRDGALPWEST
ncbi:universal stress protein [Microbacterium maritypicum]|uniref:universal stress protein n=1 Tax=Microbacterium maritypicum TaxID=33918 RepID=UPI003ECD3817